MISISDRMTQSLIQGCMGRHWGEVHTDVLQRGQELCKFFISRNLFGGDTLGMVWGSDRLLGLTLKQAKFKQTIM